MALTNAQLKERKSLLEDIEKSELKIAGHTAVIEKGTGLTNVQLRNMATNREKATQELKRQRKELSDIQKDEDKINAKLERRKQITKEYGGIEKDIMDSIKTQPKFLQKIDIAREGILENLQKAEKLEAKGSANLSRREKKELSMRNSISDSIQGILDNSANIASEEFTSYNLQKQINWARANGQKSLVAQLENMQEMQESQKHMNDVAIEGANLMRAPIDKLREVIESAPGGKFLSKLLGLETLGDKISASFLTGFRKMIGLEDELPKPEGAVGKVMGSKGQMVTEGGKAHKRDVDSGWIQAQEDAAESAEDAAESAEDQAEAAEDTKDATEGASKAMGGLKLSAIGILAAVIAWVVETVRFSMELGVAYKELSAVAVIFKEQTKAALTEFGSMRGVSDQLLFNMKKQSTLLGVESADMAKILILQTSITNQTRDMAMKEQVKWMDKFVESGLSANKVISDMASHADYLAMYLGSSMKSMAETAAYTAKMGYGLGVAESIASKLMDWESSIAAEMEMSQLLGRTINFDRARQLMLEEDHVGMLKEVKQQLGGELQWTKMGVVERQRMGEMIGLQGSQLAEFMMTEQQRVEAEAKAAALTAEQTEEQRKMDEAAAAEKAKMWGMIGMAAGAVVVAIGAGLAAALTMGVGGAAGAGWTLAAMIGGGLVGAAAGHTIGSAASKSIGGGVITPDGTIVQTDPRDFIIAGTASELTAPRTKAGAKGTESKKLIEQNDEIITLLRKMPTAYLTEQLAGDQVSATKKVGQQI